jgi:hypothetical protein
MPSFRCHLFPEVRNLERERPPSPRKLEDIAVIQRRQASDNPNPPYTGSQTGNHHRPALLQERRVYGITIEGIKYLQNRPGNVKVGATSLIRGETQSRLALIN